MRSMPFLWNLVLDEPFLRRASQHLNKPLFNFGSSKTIMSTIYHGTILDHLADFMLYLSTASSFWFSLNSSYDHDCHLSKRFGMSPHDYECLLVAANLAQFDPRWGFTMKIVQWKRFLEGHRFTTCNATGMFEVDLKKVVEMR